MNQYFDNNTELKDKDLTVNYYFNNHSFSLYSNSGVFSKNSLDFGSRLLIETVFELKLKGYTLDLGCGIGVVGLTLAYFDTNKYCFVDVNARATDLTYKNAQLLNLNDRVEVATSDSFTKINEKVFDLILLNPPIRAGKKVIYKLYKDSYDHLISGGLLFIVVRKDQGAKSHEKFLSSVFSSVSIINKDRGYFIYRCQKQ